jgi:tRNA 2-thiouridine synthesizing protein E
LNVLVNGRDIATDNDGYLLHFDDWDDGVAVAIAAEQGIALDDAHREILLLLRRFYREFEQSPAMRPLVNYTKRELGPDKGNSIYLLRLFPGSPAKIATRIAGLPRPEHCL